MIPQRQFLAGIDYAAFAVDLEQSVFRAVIAHRDITALLQSMRDAAGVAPVGQVFAEPIIGSCGDIGDGGRGRPSQRFKRVGKFGILGFSVGADDIPKGRSLGRRCLRIKVGQVERAKIGGDMAQPAGLIPAIKA